MVLRMGKSRYDKLAYGVCAVAVIALAINYFVPTSEAVSAPTKTIVAVTWDELVADQNENVLAFKAKYKNSEFKLSGSVASVIGSDTFPSVVLASPTGTQFSAEFDSKSATALAKLKPGDSIQFTCASTNGVGMQDCAL